MTQFKNDPISGMNLEECLWPNNFEKNNITAWMGWLTD